ncbi:MAG: hypothetical protein JKY14_03915 [Paraglaciecola sp.]|nr:hypothetical protein [Paraglaciecola sp.]
MFCRADKDTLGALVILLGLWCLSEALYILPANLYSLVLVYALTLILSVAFISQTTAKITFLITIISISAEVFWWHSEYTNKPQIHYLVGLLAITELARELLFKRVFILSEYLGIHSGKVALDWQLRSILLVGYSLFLAVIIEYLIRHLAGLSNLTFIYYQFGIVATILSAFTLVVVYMHYFNNQSQKHLPA